MSSSAPQLELLSGRISAATKVVGEYLASHRQTLSFAVDGPLEFPSDAPSDVLTARRELREATQQLNNLVTGPSEHLRWLACNYHDMSSLRWIYHFKIAEVVPLDKAVSFAQVAAAAGVDERQAKRILRHAMTNNLFCEPQPGLVAHTAGSSLLVRSNGIRDWVGYTSEETYPVSAKLVEATEKWGPSEEKDQTAYNIAFNTPLSMFEHVSLDPIRAERFANTMIEMTSTEGYNVRHLVNGFAWGTLDAGSTIVDVGGSVGHASVAIARAAPNLKFIVQDRPEIVAQGETVLKSEPDEQVKGRVEFEPHDFFTPQPARNADIYLLRFILHDYPDKYAVRILKNLIPALRNGTRIVVMDGVMPEPNTLPKSEERIIRIMDMEMMTTFNARERELGDWKALFTKADPRLNLRNVVKPPGSVNSVMEVVFETDSSR